MNASLPPPLVGFNNNVRYRGMRFHIQTEDSGVSRPHIITHLFADGGHIIKSLRTDYAEYLDRPDRPAVIQRLMKEQHRAMALDLRDGRLDATIDGITLSAPPPEMEDPALGRHAPKVAITRSMPVVAPPPEPSPPAPSEPESSAAKPARRKATSSRAPASKKRRPSQPPSSKGRGSSKGRPSASSVLQAKPQGDSIFGALPQESLDDVILSYVTQTKNGPPSRRPK